MTTPPDPWRPPAAPQPPYAYGMPIGYAVPARPPVKGWDIAVTVILLVLDVGVAAIASFAGLFLVMGSDSCGTRDCSTGLIVLGWLLGMGLPWVALVVTAIVAIVRLVRRRLAFWVPIVGAALIVASVFLGFAVTAAGVPSG